MKTIYIAGKVTGMPIHEVTIKFGSAQKQLEQRGYTVINPLTEVNDWHCPWPKAMRMCIAAMMRADAVLFLPDWKISRGAKVEHFLACIVKMPRFYDLKTLEKSNKK